MKDYELRKGETLTLTAERDIRIRVEESDGLMTVEARSLAEVKRAEAARLLAVADELESP